MQSAWEIGMDTMLGGKRGVCSPRGSRAIFFASLMPMEKSIKKIAFILIVLQIVFFVMNAQSAENNDSEILLLSGVWKKAIGRHLLPVGDTTDASVWADVRIPEPWPIGLIPKSSSTPMINPRIATYVFELPYSSPQSGLYLNIGEIYSAFDLYVSNHAGSFTKVLSNGDISFPNTEGRSIFAPIALPDIPAHARLVFQLSAAAYPSTRLISIPILGSVTAVDSTIWLTRTLVGLIIGIFAAVSIYNLFLFTSSKHRQWEYLAMAILAITCIVRVANHHQMTDMLVSHLFDVEPTSELASRIGWFTFPVFFAAWIAILRSLFPKDVSNFVFAILIVPSILLAVAALVADPELYITIGTYYRLLLLPLFILLVVYIIARILWYRHTAGIPIFVGAAILFTGPTMDLLAYEQGRYLSIDYSNISLIVFCMMQSLQFGQDYTESLEESAALAGELKDLNQNLEKQVLERTLSFEQANEKLELLAMSDPLTGLLNRRAFRAEFDKETSKINRYERPFVLAMIDIDFFKAVNDKWGHDTGDKVLIAIASELTHTARETDITARFGGEEFVVLLPETEPDTGHKVLERMRANIEALEINMGDTVLKITASFGMTHCNKPEDLNDVVKRADESLYQAKESGRNRLVYLGS